MQLASLINGALPPTTTELAGSAGALRSWSAGQVLDASVLRAGNGQALLQIGGQQVLAQARVPLMVGQTVRLQVEKSGTQPQLRVLDGAAAPKGALLQTVGAMTAGGGQAAGGAGLVSPLPASAGQGTSFVVGHGPGQTPGQGPGAAGDAARTVAQNAPLPASAGNVANTALAAGGHRPEAIAAQLMRQSLPHRQSMPQSMTALEQFVAMAPQSRAHPVIEQARAVAADLLRGLPRPQDVADPKLLRAMVQRSGVFHEAELARRGQVWGGEVDDGLSEQRAPSRQLLFNPPAADLKARLGALAESLAAAVRAGVQIDHGTEQAAAALRGALSNIETNQVASVRATEQGGAQSAVWRVDLPLADANGQQALEFRIAREPRGSDTEDAPPSWVADVTVRPPGQPALHARIALRGQTVYTTFTTDDESLAQRVENGESELRGLLEVVELTLGGLHCRQDCVKESLPEAVPHTLVSERA